MSCQNCGYQNSPHAVTCLKCGHRLTPVNGAVNQQSRVQRWRQQSRRTTFSSRFRPQTLLGVLIAGLLLLGGGYIVGQLLWSSTTSATAESAGKSQVHKPAASDSDAPMKATQTFPTTTVTDLVAQATNGLAGQTSVAVMPLTGSQTVVLNNRAQRAGSLITLFIMVTAFDQVHQNNWRMQDRYTLRAADKVGGTGTLHTLPAGSQLTYAEITKRMITESDNTAANIMLDRVGGFSAVNTEIAQLGLTDTKMARRLMDTAALKAGHDNDTSVRDVATVLKRLANLRLISNKADHAMLTILKANTDHSKLVKNLPTRATIYNKTGDYQAYGVQNDAAIVQNRQGTFIMTMMTASGERTAQTVAMNDLGQALYRAILEQ
ncbi:serine hydrolase [Lactiplantibacillus plantarum]|uniref:serine hydrolase n=1 Tax=Lactiplantibacillus plantarum TaxID=1590 RepID=UPI000A17A013|nr:serine hydrolase [Lactiplantibacillus plantarum]ARK34743.1 serine hydrolase [Lactiplantibacillus plantarum]QAR75563.1 serine hydrolase [Lactiplantibacillus plantarum]QAS30310.1 serine hydrolase [Lactiplantibacillus plantarum]RWZ48494.1 serine hydrolase [Lactiplantibacillus plantarum]